VSLLEILLLAAAGALGGAANAVAGGGTFFAFPVMVAFGMPTLDANATCSIGLIPGSLATGAAYWKETRERLRELAPFALLAMAGGLVGGYLLIALGDDGFRPLVPWLILIATVTFAFSKQIRPLAEKLSSGGTGARIAGYLIGAVVAIYGGFFGAGQGIMWLAALALLYSSTDFHRTNAVKNIACMLAQAVSVALLIANGLVHWPHALIIAASSIVGGYYGVAIARRVPDGIIRAVVVLIGAVLTVTFFLKR
jgi:uncharacterized membrane protein YfcA